VESVHAAADEYGELFAELAVGAGDSV
jgi:hypothetical protein